MKPRANWLSRAASCMVLLYAMLIIGWCAACKLVSDGFWLVALVNAFAIYLFAPLPLAVILAVLTRHRVTWIAALGITLLFVCLFGSSLISPFPAAHAEAESPTLTVMTYNVLLTVTDATPMLINITRASPDLIAFQELTPELAGQLERSFLGTYYPYRMPLRADCYPDVAIWSRFPFQTEDAETETPCRVRSVLLDLDGQTVRVVNVHAWSYVPLRWRGAAQSFRRQQGQIASVLHLFADKPEPLVMLGDMNSAPMQEVYRMLSAQLTDAFRQAGQGAGATYPAAGGLVQGIPCPGPLVRIDHVFHSDDWKTERAWVGDWDGASDHRPVIARLRLVEGE